MEKSSSRNLPISFFNRSAEEVAKDLLGKKIVRITPSGKRIEGLITETEAYTGILDKASHSYKGRRTKRTEIMYGGPGGIYVYFTYGMHWMLNIITSKKDDPQGVLIRSLDKVSGPGRLTKYLEIDKSLYGENVTNSKKIWIEDGHTFENGGIEKLPRVGINYAEEWKDKLLRFRLKNEK